MKLHTHDLVKKYKNRKVVDEVSVDVERGEIVGLLGPNGAGKTTTFYMIVGLIAPNEGNIMLDDQDITKEPVYKRARMGIGYLAQEASVFRKLSVEDNIRAVLEMSNLSRVDQRERVESLLEEFGLTRIRKSMGMAAKNFFGNFIESDTLNARRRRSEILVHKLRTKSNGFKNLCPAITLNRRNAHF